MQYLPTGVSWSCRVKGQGSRVQRNTPGHAASAALGHRLCLVGGLPACKAESGASPEAQVLLHILDGHVRIASVAEEHGQMQQSFLIYGGASSDEEHCSREESARVTHTHRASCVMFTAAHKEVEVLANLYHPRSACQCQLYGCTYPHTGGEGCEPRTSDTGRSSHTMPSAVKAGLRYVPPNPRGERPP